MSKRKITTPAKVFHRIPRSMIMKIRVNDIREDTGISWEDSIVIADGLRGGWLSLLGVVYQL